MSTPDQPGDRWALHRLGDWYMGAAHQTWAPFKSVRKLFETREEAVELQVNLRRRGIVTARVCVHPRKAPPPPANDAAGVYARLRAAETLIRNTAIELEIETEPGMRIDHLAAERVSALAMALTANSEQQTARLAALAERDQARADLEQARMAIDGHAKDWAKACQERDAARTELRLLRAAAPADAVRTDVPARLVWAYVERMRAWIAGRVDVGQIDCLPQLAASVDELARLSDPKRPGTAAVAPAPEPTPGGVEGDTGLTAEQIRGALEKGYAEAFGPAPVLADAVRAPTIMRGPFGTECYDDPETGEPLWRRAAPPEPVAVRFSVQACARCGGAGCLRCAPGRSEPVLGTAPPDRDYTIGGIIERNGVVLVINGERHCPVGERDAALAQVATLTAERDAQTALATDALDRADVAMARVAELEAQAKQWEEHLSAEVDMRETSDRMYLHLRAALAKLRDATRDVANAPGFATWMLRKLDALLAGQPAGAAGEVPRKPECPRCLGTRTLEDCTGGSFECVWCSGSGGVR